MIPNKYIFKLNIFLIFSIFNMVLMLLLSSCGYAPASSYASNQISKQVYVNVYIDAKNSQYTPILKDSVNEMLISKFDATLVDNKAFGTTIVDVRMSSLSFESLQTDSRGFVNFYRAKVSIDMSYNNLDKNIKKTFKLQDYYDYRVDENAISSQKAQENAVKLAIKKSLNNMFSSIAVGAI
jgi:hypothetical protein